MSHDVQAPLVCPTKGVHMLTIIVFTVIFVVVTFLTIAFSHPWDDIGAPIFGTLLFCVGGCLLTMMIVSGSPGKVIDSYEDTKLRAISSSSETSGSFFLASGTIDEKAVYKYITIREDGGFEFDSIRASNVVIFEEGDSAFMRKTNFKPTSRWTIISPPSELSFHVPVGSVQEAEYSISTQ